MAISVSSSTAAIYQIPSLKILLSFKPKGEIFSTILLKNVNLKFHLQILVLVCVYMSQFVIVVSVYGTLMCIELSLLCENPTYLVIMILYFCVLKDPIV